MITSVVLSDPARNLSFQVKPNTAIALQGLEFTAAPRPVSEPLTSYDGTRDLTQFLDAGAVTLDLTLLTATRASLDSLAAFCAPWARPYLVVTDSEWASPRQAQLRFDSHSHPVQTGVGGRRIVQYSWKAIAGVWEDTSRVVYEIGADVPDITGMALTATKGIVITATAGLAFSPSTSHAGTLIPVTGTARPRWTAKLYGPATGPKLTRDDASLDIVFADSFTIPAGQYVEIAVPDLTARYLSDPDASRLAFIDFTNTTWWDLEPQSVAQVRYHATSGTGPTSVAELIYTPVWIP